MDTKSLDQQFQNIVENLKEPASKWSVTPSQMQTQPTIVQPVIIQNGGINKNTCIFIFFVIVVVVLLYVVYKNWSMPKIPPVVYTTAHQNAQPPKPAPQPAPQLATHPLKSSPAPRQTQNLQKTKVAEPKPIIEQQKPIRDTKYTYLSELQ